MPDNFLDFITLGMGNVRSKPKGRFGRPKKDSSNYSTGERDAKISGHSSKDFSAEIRERFAEDEELKILRDTIQFEPEHFILNNLMMSIQFFDNFDEEIIRVRDSVSLRETEINDHLPPPNRAYIPDVLQQHVGRKIKFTRIDPKLNLTIGLLHPIRIYVAFENIEVTEEKFASQYSRVDQQITYYSMQLQPSPHRKGFVLLRRQEENPSRKAKSIENLDLASNGTGDEIYSDGDSLYGGKSNASESSNVRRLDKNVDSNDDQSIYGVQYGSQENMFDYPSTSRGKDDAIYGSSTSKSMDPHRRGPRNPNEQYGKPRMLASANGSLAGSTSSGYRSGNYSDSDTYASTNYNTPKTSKSSLGSVSIISGSEIPRQCFRKIEYDGDGKIYVARREKNRKLNSRDQQLRRFLKSKNYTSYFLNGTKFVKHFHQLFTKQLAEPMGFVIKNDYDKNDFQDGMICHSSLEYLKDLLSTKIEEFEIVPSVTLQWPEIAQEWVDRPRVTWPSYKIIENVKKTVCHLIPQGIRLENPNRYSDLEWQLVFPAAERYLETCLTCPQVKVYLIALMLRKTFMRRVDSNVGLAATHIKHILFKLVEDDNNPAMWTETRTGDSLIHLLNTLYGYIKQDTPYLPDYFLRNRNLFQDRPGLHFTQKQLNRIMDNPVMYVFHAMENIRHYRDSFPRLNFEELFKILTFPTVSLANAALAELVSRPGNKTNRQEDDSDWVGIWDKNQQKDSENIYARKKVTKRNLVNPKLAEDQIVEISVRCEKMEPRRLSSLLDFFIRHFIKMAECCHNNRALAQKVAYVDHAERLSVLLSEYPKHSDIAQTYLQKLYSLKRRPARTRSQNAPPPPTPPPNPPETPKRNPDQAIFVRPLNDRYTRRQETEKSQQFIDIPVNGETIEYELESARSSVYNLQPPPEARKIQASVTVMIHEEDTEEVQLQNSNEVSPTTDDEKKSSSKVKRVVSIANNKGESFLSETKL